MRCCRLVGWKVPTNFEVGKDQCNLHWTLPSENKINLRDLIAATGLVISLKLDSNHQLFSPFDLEIWWMTFLEKNIGHAFFIMSSFVHRFKSIGEFKLELQSGNTQFRSKSVIFLSGVTLKFDGWPWKTIGHLFLATSVCIISSPYVISNWSYGPETAKLGFDLCDLDLWPLILIFCMDFTSVIGNKSWKFHDDTTMGTLYSEKGVTDRRTDRQTDGLNHS